MTPTSDMAQSDRVEAAIHYCVGDATAPEADGPALIAHGCNDIGAWGKGFVLQVSARWAAPERAYRAWHRGLTGQPFGLGEIQPVQLGPTLAMVNMITQRGIAAVGGVPPIRYDALRQCLQRLAREAARRGASVHMPRIGCGLAGGAWPQVEAIIMQTLIAARVPVCVYELPGASARA